MRGRFLLMKRFIALILILILLSTSSLGFEDEKIPVIIIFRGGEEKGALSVKSGDERGYLMRTLAREMEKGKIDDLRELWIINGIAMKASPDIIEGLKKRPEVLKIIPDLKVRLLDEKITGQSDSEISWNLEMIDAPKIWELGVNGTGVNVSVIDTGIDASHIELKNKVVAWKDLVNDRSSPYDDHGHGTHVAGIIAGESTGVAPGASLIAVKVFDSNGMASTSDVIEGFQWSVVNGADVISYSGGLLPFEEVPHNSYSIPPNSTFYHNFTVEAFKYEEAFKPSSILAEIESSDAENLNVSLISPSGEVLGEVQKEGTEIKIQYSGDEPLPEGSWSLRVMSVDDEEIRYDLSVKIFYPSNGSSTLDMLLNNISLSGIPVVVAAGNDGEFGFRTINSPGSAREAITVGATAERSYEIASFSSRGPVGFEEECRVKPDVVAPGENIRSAYPGGGYALMSGTSMATPHVSGIVAMMLQVNRSLSPSEIREILERTSLELGEPGKDNIYGAGMVNAYYAVLNSTQKGDVSLDGKVEIDDAVMIAQMVIGKISENPLGDLNGNGRVDIGDLAKIVYYINSF